MRLPFVKMFFFITLISSHVVGDSLYIDYFTEHLSKEVDCLKKQRIKAFKSLSVEDDLYTFYYLLGAEEEGQRLLQKYLEYCINDQIKLRFDDD